MSTPPDPDQTFDPSAADTDPPPPIGDTDQPASLDAPEWAAKLVDSHAFVLHTPSGVIGRVREYKHAGEWVGLNGQPCKSAVLVVDPGHGFSAEKPEAFTVLDARQAGFVDGAGKAMRHFIGEVITMAASMGLPADLAAKMLASLLGQQASLLRAAVPAHASVERTS